MKLLARLAAIVIIPVGVSFAQAPGVFRDISCNATTASGTAYGCSVVPAFAAYVTGQKYAFTADVANTASATINLNSHGALTLKKMVGGVATNLAANDIGVGQRVEFYYTGVYAQVTSALGTTGGSGPPTGAAAGDLSGTYPNPGVAKVNGNTPGNTCTNQFERSIDSSGRGTCASIATADLPNTAVTLGTYGDSTHVPQFTVDATGRVTLVSNVAIAGGAGSGTVNAGTANQTAYYPGAGTAVSGGGPGSAGQVWTSNGAGSAPTFQAPSGGGSGPPWPTLTLASNILTFGANCSSGTPCGVQTGSVVNFITAPTNISAPTGSGLLYIYMDYLGVVSVGKPTGVTALTCASGCTVVSGVTQFPLGPLYSKPLYTWNITSNNFDGSGVNMQTAGSSSGAVAAGTNMTITCVGNLCTYASTGVGGGATIAATTSALKGDGAGNGAAVTGAGTNCVHVDGTSAACSGGGGTDPMDMTIWTKVFNWAESGSSTTLSWSFVSANCTGASGSGINTTAVGELTGVQFVGSDCYTYYPSFNNTANGTFKDFMSGGSPKTSKFAMRAIIVTLNVGAIYMGWADSHTTIANNFVGIVYAGGANQFLCTIKSAGTTLVQPAITFTPDTNPHTFLITQTSANSISCSIDGGTPVVASATIPAAAGGLFALMGTNGAATTFAAIESRLQITGLTR